MLLTEVVTMKSDSLVYLKLYPILCLGVIQHVIVIQVL